MKGEALLSATHFAFPSSHASFLGFFIEWGCPRAGHESWPTDYCTCAGRSWLSESPRNLDSAETLLAGSDKLQPCCGRICWARWALWNCLVGDHSELPPGKLSPSTHMWTSAEPHRPGTPPYIGTEASRRKRSGSDARRLLRLRVLSP